MKHLNLIFFILCVWSCTKQKKPINEINASFERASSFNDKGQTDSAFYYFFKAKDLAVIQKDSLMIGKCLVNLAILSTNKRDDLIGQEFSLDALSYLRKENKEHHPYLSYNYNNLGNACQNLRDYNEAIKFYDLAIKFTNDPENINAYLNNKAYLFQETKQYKKALLIYDLIRKQKSQNQTKYARTLANISFTKWLLNTNYKASSELLKSLIIREKENDSWGKNSSYYYLAEYYERSRPDSALFYANKMYEVAKELNSSDDKLYALQKLIRLSPIQLKNHYFEQYIKIDDSALTVRNKDKHQFALIRYRSRKNEEENLKLQKDNEEKKYQVIILAFGILLLAVAGTIWYRKRKQRLELEAQTRIHENKLKTSQKVHDVVANGLYRIMNKLDNQKTLKDNPIIDEIEELYEQSRDLSYEKPKSKNLAFQESISELLKTFASDDTKVIIVGNSTQLWEKVSDQAKYEIEHILQEMMINMDKHSQASDVIIRFEQVSQRINIYYTDNGIGMSGEIQSKNGLTSTVNRIDTIGGTITFDTKVEKGLKIQISFPVS